MTKRCVAIYIRVLATEADHQLLELRHFAEKQGWQVLHEYFDEPIEDYLNVKLPKLNRLLSDSSLNVFDLVLFYKFSEFTHPSYKHSFQHRRKLSNSNNGWHIFQKPFFSTNSINSDLMFNFLNLFESSRKSKISKQTKIGIQDAKQLGAKCGHPSLPSETIEEIFHMLKEGKSYNEISSTVLYKGKRGRLKHPALATISKIRHEHLFENRSPKNKWGATT